MSWTPLWFGKYRGKTLPQVLFSDPDWFFWAIEEKIFDDKGILTNEARELDRKARNIRIPSEKGEDMVAEFIINPHTHKIDDLSIVPRTRSQYEHASRIDIIDLSYPRQFSHYNKLGYKNILSTMKGHLFGDFKHLMTKARCEAFYDDDSNFVI